MKEWRREFQKKYMALDIKPFGKWKKAIEGSNRMKARKEARKEAQKHMALSKVLDENEDR